MTLLKGALVSYTSTFLTPLPNVTVFEYNPESITHTWTQPDRPPPPAHHHKEAGNPYAVPGLPGEEFSLTIMLDSNQDIADTAPVSAQLASASGLYTRLSALEMLLYPVNSSDVTQLLGQTSAALGLGDVPKTTKSTNSVLPVVLFVWGLARVVPVRIKALTITEKLYDEVLNPVQAQVQLTLRVLTLDELNAALSDNQALAGIAQVAYTYTLGLREAGALANLGNVPAALAGIF